MVHQSCEVCGQSGPDEGEKQNPVRPEHHYPGGNRHYPLPHGKIFTQDFMVILYRYAESKGYDTGKMTSISKYSDAKQTEAPPKS